MIAWMNKVYIDEGSKIGKIDFVSTIMLSEDNYLFYIFEYEI